MEETFSVWSVPGLYKGNYMNLGFQQEVGFVDQMSNYQAFKEDPVL
jgi:hypothetical protein